MKIIKKISSTKTPKVIPFESKLLQVKPVLNLNDQKYKATKKTVDKNSISTPVFFFIILNFFRYEILKSFSI